MKGEIPRQPRARIHRLFVLLSFICALPFTAAGQMEIIFETTDHSGVIKYGANRFGLEQITYVTFPKNGVAEQGSTVTTIYFGSRTWRFNSTVWPILAVVVVVISPLVWLAMYGIGSFARRPKKHPPPTASPP
jgi:hypothetical protein